jgi:hypothetical protein
MYVPRMKVKFDEKSVLIITMVIMALVLLVSPWIGMLVSGGLLMVRVILEVLFDNAASVAVNRNTESSVRATTLSTLSLLQSLPYAIGGTFVGSLVIVAGGARNFSMWFGLVLMVLTVILGLRMEREKA